ncbi:MAG: DUF1732 domain-containing protein [Bacteroidales bacterium]|nr:DUF1732 domain-containing protein [Bacteroidales bacterium]
MLRSMTGFGRVHTSIGNSTVAVMVRTLNNKQLDLSVKTPFRYRERENQRRDIAANILLRGKVDINVIIEDVTNADASVNKILAEKYFTELSVLSDHLGINKPDNWMEILIRLPEVVGSGNPVVEEDEWLALFELVRKACEETDAFRMQEGAVLETDMIRHLDVIEKLLPEIEQLDPERKIQVRERLVKELQQAQLDVKTDETRLEQELFYYIDKFDINEEKVRLAKHIEYFRNTLKQNDSEPAGKKLGFIAQEMGREINTLGNKSNFFDIQKRVVVMKDELEKIKEQLANIL